MNYQTHNLVVEVISMFDEEVLKRMRDRDHDNLARSADMERDAATVRFTGISASEADAGEQDRLEEGIEKAIEDVLRRPNINGVVNNVSAFTWRGVLSDVIQRSIATPKGDEQIDAIKVDSVRLQTIITYNDQGNSVSIKPLNMLKGWSLQRLFGFLSRVLADNYVNSVPPEDAYNYVIKEALVELIKGVVLPLSLEMIAIVNIITDNTSSAQRCIERSRVLEKFKEITEYGEAEFARALEMLIDIGAISPDTDDGKLVLTENIWKLF